MGNKPTLYGLLAIAGFLLLLGCINFINLTTAQSSTRAKEIGIRKTMGSSKRQLIIQFMGETFLLTLIATFLSCLLTPLVLKLFADFIPPGIRFPAICRCQYLALPCCTGAGRQLPFRRLSITGIIGLQAGTGIEKLLSYRQCTNEKDDPP